MLPLADLAAVWRSLDGDDGEGEEQSFVAQGTPAGTLDQEEELVGRDERSERGDDGGGDAAEPDDAREQGYADGSADEPLGKV